MAEDTSPQHDTAQPSGPERGPDSEIAAEVVGALAFVNPPAHDAGPPVHTAPPVASAAPYPWSFDAPPSPPPVATRAGGRSVSLSSLVALVAATGFLSFLAGAGSVAYLWSTSYRVEQTARRDPANHPDRVISTQPLGESVIPKHVENLKPVSAADLAFGEQQVTRMTRDRPEMLRYVVKGDAVWKHCARAFGGASIGERVYWDSSPPETDETPAEHMGPWQGASGYIRVRGTHESGYQKGVPLTCEELWSAAVYELENIRGTPGFNKLFTMALEGKLTREQWIRESTRLEYEACRRTGELYKTLWLPMSRSRGVPSTGAYWFVDVPSTYEEWIAGYDDPNAYPWSDTGKYWDQEIEPYLRRLGG